MNFLVFGFYGEGNRDYDFVFPVVQRILNDRLPNIDIYPVEIKLESKAVNLIDTMLEVARAGCEYHFIVFHQDADAPNRERCYNERFLPGYNSIQQRNEPLNKEFIPIIPVRMTEAWMLVDFEAFQQVTGTNRTASDLSFPQHPHQVEALEAPKSIYEQAVRNSRNLPKRRRRNIDPASIYIPLARQIRLERLRLAPAFQDFETELTSVLRRLRYLE